MSYSDEYIEHWGKIYEANPVLRAHYVLFETFLEAPEVLLNHYAFCRPPSHVGPLPLLPAQRDVMAQVSRDDRCRPDPETIESHLMAGTECRLCDGRYLEPLHHHRYSDSRDRRNVS